MDFLNELNKDQKEAVLATKGPVLVIAGAGAGKTKTLTSRILYLIKQGIKPSSILAITFTNKASKEMKERVEKLLNKESSLSLDYPHQSKPFISTFHSLGVHIIRENHRKFNLNKNFNILDRDDSKKIIKEALQEEGLDPKQYAPSKILSLISRNKGNFTDLKEFEEKTGNDFFPSLVLKVWKRYEKKLQEEKGLDFDDLLVKTATLLKEDKEIRGYYQGVWRYIHIDEYQDTNKVQYQIAKLLTNSDNNVFAVADVDQCLPAETKISTPCGTKNISDIKKGDIVLCGSGQGELSKSQVIKVKKRKNAEEIFNIKTKSGVSLKITANHLVFSKLPIRKDIFYTYLMYRKDMGYRIGIVQGSIKNGYKNNKNSIGLIVRSNQEKADKIWVLKISKSRQEAQYFEYLYSFKYKIPTIVFFTSGRNMSLDQKYIDSIYKEIDTKDNVKNLFKDLGLSFEFPHYTPQCTAHLNSKKRRTNIRLVMFSDKRKSLRSPWGLSRVSINTTDGKLKNKLIKAGYKVIKGRKDDWRLEIMKIDYGEAEDLANKLLKVDGTLNLYRESSLIKDGNVNFTPVKSLREHMEIVVYKNGNLVVDTIKKIKKEDYFGFVYDLDIDKTHNYIANNICVHNCIYSWRGSDIANVLKFEKDFKNAKVIKLEQNYRSTSNILNASNEIIKKNKKRYEKNLYTENEEGEKLSICPSFDENSESSFVAGKIKDLIKKGVDPEGIAVLYRTNFQSRVLEEAMLRENIPYQVLGTKFFQRKEVKDILSFLKTSLNRDNKSELKRIINTPPKGIGKVSILKIFSGKEDELKGKTKEKVQEFWKLLDDIQNFSLKNKPSKTLDYIFKNSGYKKMLEESKDEERIANIYELISLSSKYDFHIPQEGINKLLEDASLASDQDEMEEKTNSVKLMTIHASKGLEFDCVFITGLEEGLFPSQTVGDNSQKDEEEERRLFYVALTRAKKRVFLTYAGIRMVYGNRQYNEPSQFILDLDPRFTKEEYLEGDRNSETKEKIIYLDF